MRNNLKKGRKAEERAAHFLLEKGYEILEKNYRYSYSEIDLIALNKEVLVFVEVKSRKSTNFGFPEEAVTEAKQTAVKRAAEAYILKTDWKKDIRFDIIAINGINEIEHFEDAF